MTMNPNPTASAGIGVSINRIFAGVGAALGLVLGFLFFQLPLAFTAGLFSTSHPRFGAFLGFMGILMVVPGTLAIARFTWGTGWRKGLPLAMVSPWVLVWTILCVTAFFPVEFAWFSTVERIVGWPNLPDLKAPLVPLWLVGVLFVAPLAEEVLFRGYGLARILELGGERRALLFTAIVFALLHGHWLKIPGTFITGLFLGWLVLRTDSLWPALIGHFITNLIPLLLGLSGRLSPSNHQVSLMRTLVIGAVGLTFLLLLWAPQIRGRIKELSASY